MHNNHYQFHHHFIDKPLNQLYISMAVRSFGISMVGLFIPIYLHIQLGYSLAQTFSYFISMALVVAFASPFVGVLSRKIGVKHIILLSTPIYMVALYLLYLLEKVPISLILIGAIGGVGSALFWFGFHYAFYVESDKKHRGQEVGTRLATSLLASFIGPILGGILIKQFGFGSVFIICAVSLVLAALFLFISPDIKTDYHFSFKNIHKNYSNKIALFFLSRGMIDTGQKIAWPLFIFYILNSYVSLGMTQSVITIVSICILFFAGKLSDKHSKNKIARTFSVFEMFNWGVRSVVYSTWHIFAVTIWGGINSAFYSPAISAIEYDHALTFEPKHRTSYFIQREFFVSIGRVLILLLMLFIGDFSQLLLLLGLLQMVVFIF